MTDPGDTQDGTPSAWEGLDLAGESENFATPPNGARCSALINLGDDWDECWKSATKVVAQPAGPGGRYCCDEHGNELRRV